MNARILGLSAMLALLSASSTAAADPPPPPPELPKLDVSTMLFLMLSWNGPYADMADPIDINHFDIDFGDDSSTPSDLIDEALQDR